MKSIFAWTLFLLGSAHIATAANAPLATAPDVNLKEYTGLWYEIARLPNRFQEKCVADTTASYNLNPDGTIQVMNRCQKGLDEKGQPSFAEAIGQARLVDPNVPSKLKVSFVRAFWTWWFSGDYWILRLGRLNGQLSYAVVGEPSRRYAWILSRTPRMDPTVFDSLRSFLQQEGFESQKLVMTRHSAL